MKEYTTYKASPLASDEQEDAQLNINISIDLLDEEIGTKPGWEQRWRDTYRTQAKHIENLLHNSLPGGTYDALLVAMMERKRSIFKVKL